MATNSTEIPDHTTIIDRLKHVAKIQSDAGLSKWLGKPDSFIAVCRNRGGINIDVVVPKLSNSELLYVLRGDQTQGETSAVQQDLLRPQRVWAALGNPNHKSLATRLGITPERAREILAEDALNPQELATLLDEVASIAMAVTDSRAHSRRPPRGRGTQAPPSQRLTVVARKGNRIFVAPPQSEPPRLTPRHQQANSKGPRHDEYLERSS